jgi:hypothetical protein
MRQASLGIDLADGGPLSSNFKIVNVARGQSDQTYAVYPGKCNLARDHYRAEQGIEHHTLDGFDRAWYGGPTVPYQGADITQSVPEIDLPEVLSYARQKGVRLRLWLHWQAAKAHMRTL